MDFHAYQIEAEKTDETGKGTVALYGLAGEIGGLFSLFKKRLRDRQVSSQFRDDLKEELGDILWYVAALASRNGISLDDVARYNLEKINHLFSDKEALFFDTKYDDSERLPDNFTARFIVDNSSKRVSLFVDEVPVGDSLSDNVLDEDDYRFHDVFHLSFLAHLHWSPVLRSLLKRKRKSDPTIDEAEDGARAAIVEEAAIGIIFSFAEQNTFFSDRKSIPFGLIKILQRLTSKYEVSSCSAKQWRDAIYDGCAVFLLLSKNRGGSVNVDAIEGRIDYSN